MRGSESSHLRRRSSKTRELYAYFSGALAFGVGAGAGTGASASASAIAVAGVGAGSGARSDAGAAAPLREKPTETKAPAGLSRTLV